MDAPPPLPSQDKVMMKPMEEMITNTTTKSSSTPQERKLVKHEKDHKAILNCPCPRCHSSNTKFCYYNNYSLTQPRYFCKACKRYWTQGGSLRSIPVGGKARKTKRPSSSSSSSSSLSSSKFKIPDLVESSSNANILTNPNPKFIHHPQDLNLGFTPNLLQLPISDHFIYNQQTINASNNSYINSSVMAPFLPMVSYQNPVYPVGLSLDGIGSGGRILFPFEDLKSTKTTTATGINAKHHQEHSSRGDEQITKDDHHQHGDSAGYWTGNIF